ncbi:PKD domain-containing protein [Streptacidiphilus cavernicola]|uniref:PKD domain-containing protein n=1 Tax=Streptacidiphilus cavernicola TaxID=3342716 RepID=A0ABV6VW20_9ACTN
MTAAAAVSVALVPGLAFAAAPHAATAGAAKVLPATATPKVGFASAGARTFSSPAAKSVRVRTASGRGSAAAPQTVDPTLAVAVDAANTTGYGVALDVNVTSATGIALTATYDWGDGTTPGTGTLNGPGALQPTHEYAKLGTYTITVTVTDGQGDTVSNGVDFITLGSDYTAYGPTRLLDTRAGTGAAKAKVAAHGTVHLQVGGKGTIPAGATAAVLNVTVTDAVAPGFITAYDHGDTRPTTSNVNFVKGQTVPNQVIVPIGANGQVDLYNGSSGSVDLIADIAGYFTQSASSGYTPLAPYRIVDTRSGVGAPKKQLAGKASVAAQVAGNDKGKLPTSGITAVALNVTVTGSLSSGFLTVYPDGKSLPTASNVNFTKGQTIANSVIAPVGSDGKIRIYNGSGKAASVIVDVVGYYSTASKSVYVPVPPKRLIDTRAKGEGGPLSAYSYLPLSFSDGEPDITAFALNTTVTTTKASGYLAVAPDPNTQAQYDNRTAKPVALPAGSTLNWLRGQTVPNLVQASTGKNGIIDFFNASSGSSNLIIDIFGFYGND